MKTVLGLIRANFIFSILLYCFFCNYAYSFVAEIQIWKNEKTGQTVSLGGSIHNLGTKEQNEDQMKFFIDNVIMKCEKSKKKMDVLFEGDVLYFTGNQMTSLLTNEDFVEELFPDENTVVGCIINKTESFYPLGNEGDECDWIQNNFVCDMFKNRKIKPKHVSLESIDPRMPLQVWQFDIKNTGLADIANMGKYIGDINNYIENEDKENAPQPLKEVLQEYQRKIDSQINNLFFGLPRNEKDAKEIMLTYSNEEILRRKLVSPQTLKRIADKLAPSKFGAPPKLAVTLDREAIWKMANPNAKKNVFLLVGSGHLTSITEAMTKLGYVQIHNYKTDQKFEKQEQVSGPDEQDQEDSGTKEKEYILKVPEGLDEGVKEGFKEAVRKMRCKK